MYIQSVIKQSIIYIMHMYHIENIQFAIFILICSIYILNLMFCYSYYY